MFACDYIRTMRHCEIFEEFLLITKEIRLQNVTPAHVCKADQLNHLGMRCISCILLDNVATQGSGGGVILHAFSNLVFIIIR